MMSAVTVMPVQSKAPPSTSYMVKHLEPRWQTRFQPKGHKLCLFAGQRSDDERYLASPLDHEIHSTVLLFIGWEVCSIFTHCFLTRNMGQKVMAYVICDGRFLFPLAAAHYSPLLH